MKKLIISIILASIVNVALSQQYRVIRVDGTILLKKTNKPISKGAVISPNEEFIFKSPNARAAVILPGKGRYVLQADNSTDAYTKAKLAPAMSNISSRSGAINNKVALRNYFEGKYVIIDKVKIRIPSEFPMNDSSFFYISYKYKGETVNKKLSYIDDTLIIDRSELLTIDNKPIPNPYITDMKLIYLTKDREENSIKNIFINKFNPVFPKPEELKEEIAIILDSMSDKSREQKINEVFSFINDFYGKPDKKNLEIWLKKEFGL